MATLEGKNVGDPLYMCQGCGCLSRAQYEVSFDVEMFLNKKSVCKNCFDSLVNILINKDDESLWVKKLINDNNNSRCQQIKL